MRTWEDYKSLVKAQGKDEKENMEQIDKISSFWNPDYNEETIAAIQEAQEIAAGATEAKPQSVDSFFKEMGL